MHAEQIESTRVLLDTGMERIDELQLANEALRKRMEGMQRQMMLMMRKISRHSYDIFGLQGGASVDLDLATEYSTPAANSELGSNWEMGREIREEFEEVHAPTEEGSDGGEEDAEGEIVSDSEMYALAGEDQGVHEALVDATALGVVEALVEVAPDVILTAEEVADVLIATDDVPPPYPLVPAYRPGSRGGF